jgi:hydrogenase/urease accessory protein HupE
MTRRSLAFFILLLLYLPTLANAHELRPAFLSITETQAEPGAAHYEILWKTPALGEKQLALKAIFPPSCTVSNGHRRVEKSKFAIEIWTLTCPQSLRGQALRIGGLEKTLTDVLVKTNWQDGNSFTARLTPEHTRLDFAKPRSYGGVVASYFSLGVKHILSGTDHLLFVLAVILLVQGRRKLFFAITAFTLGHSVTLALATLNVVQLNPTLVELLIAMSIILMAYEAARHWQGHSGLTFEYPWVVTFTFGLLHGFGFAGALREIGLPQGDIPAALLFFNVGVEAGQLMFIGAVFALVSLPRLNRLPANKIAMLSVSYGIGVMAVFWTLQRAVPAFPA